MSAARSRKVQKAYDKYLQSRAGDEDCDFCTIKPGDENYVAESAHFKIIANAFPYSRWDSQHVAEHLMILPKVHILSLSKLSSKECDEYVALVSDYEFKGYSIYARAPGSKSRSIPHQHTHLFKLLPKQPLKTFRIRAKNAG